MISAVILAKNSRQTLGRTLASLKGFSEVILIDTGSTDDTVEIAKTFPNVRIFFQDFCGFGKLRNLGASFAVNDWILAIDSDEVLSDPLIEELQSLDLDERKIYSFPFHNFYRGKQVKCCGWHPESHIRLYSKKTTSFDQAEVHEGVKAQGLQTVHLRHPVHHFPYRSIADFLSKMQHYSTLFAKQHKNKRKSSFGTAFTHAAFAFLKSYLLKKGVFYGSTGFIISSYNAATAFYKYLKLEEENSTL